MKTWTRKEVVRWGLVIGFITIFAACDVGESITVEAEQEQETILFADPLVEYLVAIGFALDDIEDDGAYLVVEGDIAFSKSDLRQYIIDLEAAAKGGGDIHEIAQQRQTPLVDWSNSTSIVVKVHSSLSGTDWDDAVTDAIAEWNAVNSTKLSFTESGTADITVYDEADPAAPDAVDDLQACTLAMGTPPASGQPGPAIGVNLDYRTTNCTQGSAPSDDGKKYNMAHELGHNIGLFHTNTGDGTTIPTTASSDTYSVMNGGTANEEWDDNLHFTGFDKNAVQTLYPYLLYGHIMIVNPPGSEAEMEVGISGGRPNDLVVQRKSGSSWIVDNDWDCPINSSNGGHPAYCTLPQYLWSSKSGQEVRLRLRNSGGDHVKYSSSAVLTPIP